MAAAVETAGSGQTGAVEVAGSARTDAVEAAGSGRTGAVEAAGSGGTTAIRARLCNEQVRSDRDCGWKKRGRDAGKKG